MARVKFTVVESQRDRHCLREEWFEVNRIISHRSDHVLDAQHQEKPLVKDLDPKHRFSILSVDAGNGVRKVHVVGDPDEIAKTLSDNPRELLKG